MNLLSNALKFTPEGDAMRVEVAETGDGVEVAVHDSGPGIPPEEQALLVEKFSQTSGGSPSGEGAGSAWSFAGTWSRPTAGRIWVESEPGRGTRFAFRLPRNGPTAEPQAVGGRASPASARDRRRSFLTSRCHGLAAWTP